MRNSLATPSGTAARILDVAERLAQTRGYNGFSYADVAAEVGVTKASLHYHFPSKAVLGQTLMERYTERFKAQLEFIANLEAPAMEKLRKYVDIYSDALNADRMCLCGILAAEWATLPESIQESVRAFFGVNEQWLERLLAYGLAEGGLHFETPAAELASVITSALEGAMLMARSGSAPSRFESVATHLLRSVTPAA